MSDRELVISTAKELDLLDDDGNLVQIDSLTMIDLLTELETRTGLEFPASSLRLSTFESISSITALIESLRAPSASRVA